MNNIQEVITSEYQLTKSLAFSMAVKRGIRNKNIVHLALFEKEIGRFPDDINEFTKQLMRLQGFDPDDFLQQEGIDVIIEIHKVQGDRVLIVAIAF